MIIARKSKLELNGTSLSLDFALPSSVEERVQSLARGGEAKSSLNLVLSGIAATPEGIEQGADYRIYVNLPAGSGKELPAEDFYVGSINTFALSDPKHKGHGAQRFDLGRIAPALEKHDLWKPGEISVSFVSDDTEGAAPLITIDEIQLELSNE